MSEWAICSKKRAIHSIPSPAWLLVWLWGVMSTVESDSAVCIAPKGLAILYVKIFSFSKKKQLFSKFNCTAWLTPNLKFQWIFTDRLEWIIIEIKILPIFFFQCNVLTIMPVLCFCLFYVCITLLYWKLSIENLVTRSLLLDPNQSQEVITVFYDDFSSQTFSVFSA